MSIYAGTRADVAIRADVDGSRAIEYGKRADHDIRILAVGFVRAGRQDQLPAVNAPVRISFGARQGSLELNRRHGGPFSHLINQGSGFGFKSHDMG